METALIKQSHTDRWLEQGYYLALQFMEGWVCFRITGREPSKLRPYSLGAVAAGGNIVAGWNTIQGPNAVYYLQPRSQNFIYHHFWGVTPTAARVYTQFPSQKDIGSLLASTRNISLADGDVGYLDGNDSPYAGPFNPATELFCVYEKYPAVQVLNPLTNPMANVKMSFDTMKYTFMVIKSQAMISELLVGTRRVRKYTMGPIDPSPTTIPKWLSDLVSTSLLDYTKKVMEEQL
jgi:hypothetical protein